MLTNALYTEKLCIGHEGGGGPPGRSLSSIVTPHSIFSHFSFGPSVSSEWDGARGRQKLVQQLVRSMQRRPEYIVLKHFGDRQQRAVVHTGFVWFGIVVPYGTVTDGLSVPWFIAWLFGRFGKYLLVAIVHDYLYHNQVSHTRKQADKIFYDGLRILGCGYLKARFAYYCLRLFGGRAWKQHA